MLRFDRLYAYAYCYCFSQKAMVICAGIDRKRSGVSAQEIEHRTDHGLCDFCFLRAQSRTV